MVPQRWQVTCIVVNTTYSFLDVELGALPSGTVNANRQHFGVEYATKLLLT